MATTNSSSAGLKSTEIMIACNTNDLLIDFVRAASGQMISLDVENARREAICHAHDIARKNSREIVAAKEAFRRSGQKRIKVNFSSKCEQIIQDFIHDFPFLVDRDTAINVCIEIAHRLNIKNAG